MENLKKNAVAYLVFFSIFLYTVLLFLIFRKNKENNKTADEKADGILPSSMSEQNKEIYKRIVQKIVTNLGTNNPWWHPNYWTENDKLVFEQIKILSSAQFKIVADLYPTYAKGRDLREDLSKYLDTKYYQQLKNI